MATTAMTATTMVQEAMAEDLDAEDGTGNHPLIFLNQSVFE